ncbi:MAG: terminase [SAR202 cluster bacterium]|jgi:hypothetical protein|nr:terminase [SAR202 cluster bacterium]
MARGSSPRASDLADARWRLSNLYRIIDKEGQEILFRPNWAQLRLLEELWYLNVILKARQLGMTTCIQLLMLDACLFTSNIRAGVIAHNRDDAETIFRDKIKFAYDNLPRSLRTQRPATLDSARELTFSNNSSIRVGTSLRSGTLNYLHVSEYGKICAKYPEKAREVRTGAFNTLQAGQLIFVESTAEGQEGDFYEMCQTAKSKQRRGSKLTPLDFKFFFFPWWEEPGYAMDPSGVVIPEASVEYFERLRREHGIELSAAQQAWYVKRAEVQEEDMKREYPSTSKEAFETSVEGAYYAAQFAKIDDDRRIGAVPLIPDLPVWTWWDLGMNDLMTIWFIQWDGPWVHAIDYYQNSGEGLGHYAGILQEKQRDRGYVYGGHLWPHDGNVRILDETGRHRHQVMAGLGYEVEVVSRGMTLAPGIQQSRTLLARARFDEQRCAEGLRALRSYRREWDDGRGAWKSTPRHDWASHGADAWRTGAMYGHPEDYDGGEGGDGRDQQGRSSAGGY